MSFWKRPRKEIKKIITTAYCPVCNRRTQFKHSPTHTDISWCTECGVLVMSKCVIFYTKEAI